ncbi:hypothetical protein VPH35_067478 [Triticum aestivum]
MERCEMDVGRSGHGAVCSGPRRRWPGSGGGSGWRRPRASNRHGKGPVMWLLKVRFILDVTEPCLIGHVPRARCLPVRAGVDGAEGGPVHWQRFLHLKNLGQ